MSAVCGASTTGRHRGWFGRPGLWGLRFAPRTYFPFGDCVVLRATGVRPQSFVGERSPGRRRTSSMGRWCPSGGPCSQNNLWIVLWITKG